MSQRIDIPIQEDNHLFEAEDDIMQDLIHSYYPPHETTPIDRNDTQHNYRQEANLTTQENVEDMRIEGETSMRTEATTPLYEGANVSRLSACLLILNLEVVYK